MSLKIKLGAAALNTTPIDWAGNRQAIMSAITEAHKQGVQLLCLPELCVTGYGCEDWFLNPHVREEAREILNAVAAETPKGIAVTVGIPVEIQGCVYNAVAVIVGDAPHGRVIGLHCKQHLAGDGIHYEPRWFKAWPTGVVGRFNLDETTSVPLGDTLFEIEYGNDSIVVGFEICESAWVSQRPGAVLARAGVDIILNPSASHFSFGKTKTRERFVVDASRAFNCAYVYANLLGNEAGRVTYDGDCLIATNGQLVGCGERFGMKPFSLTTAVVDISVNRVNRTKIASFKPIAWATIKGGKLDATKEQANRPVTRKELTKIEEFFRAESLALWDYNRKCGCDGFVISLSGGADSALCAILVEYMLARAIQQIADDDRDALLEKLGMDPLKKFLTCIYQPTANSSQETFRAAELVSKALGCRFEVKNVQSFVVDIEGAAQEYLGRFLSYDEDSVARQNLQARARVMYPWMIANLENKILITTSNRSEAAVGYCTMDGDTAGSLGPIGGVDKEFILEVLDFIVADRTSEDLGKAIKAVRSKAPTAELLPAEKNQTDEGDLMPFGILNNIERAVIIHRKSPQEIVDDAIAVAPQVQKFFTKFARNQWKRERLAVSFHMDDENLDPRSFTRFPILNGGFKVELERLSK